MYIYLSPVTHTAYNLALEEYLLQKPDNEEFLLFWQSKNAIVIGRHQNTAEEINAQVVRDNDITVVRRSSGGGAVYQDMGNLNFSFITDAANAEQRAMARFTRPVIDALAGLQVHAEASGRNDILIDGKKISGNAQMRQGTRMLHHGTLLFSANLEVAAAALQVQPDKFQSKSAKSVRSRVTNIQEHIKESLSVEDFTQHMLQSFQRSLQCTPLTLQSEDMDAVAVLQQKYESWEWTYGKSPLFTLHNRQRYTGGLLEVFFNIHKGCIKECQICGDFMALRPVEELMPAIIGRRFDKETLRANLTPLPLQDYFGTISLDEVLHCFFLTHAETDI